MSWGPYRILKDGQVTKEEVRGHEIKKILSTKVVYQTLYATWYESEVDLKDGRRVTIREVSNDQKEQLKK